MTEELNLENFNKSIESRLMTFDDIEEVVRLQEVCFPGMEPWKKNSLNPI